ncbi:MAG: DNA repair exonuclease [Phycisphaerales bacterium]
MSSLRLLIAGDLHLGRASSRVTAQSDSDVTARAALDRLVDAAIRENADLLCLTGDVADDSNRFWEALGPLTRGITRLAEEGIVTLAVSGNHDHDVLPRLAAQLDSQAFRLLGREGNWERYTHEVNGSPVLHVDGWSFPQEHVRLSPVDTYEPRHDAAVPTVAMVHGDLDVATSPYAPLERQQLLSLPILGWLLGHIHAPMCEEQYDRPFLVYPGSPQALDPGEPGEHGAVLAELQHGRFSPLRRIPLSTVRYDALDVDLSGVEDESAFARRVREDIEDCASSAAEEGNGVLKHLSLRLTLTGRTAIAGDLRTEARGLENDFETTVDGVHVAVDRVRLDVLPEIDLEEHAQTNTPPGMIARLLLDIEHNESTTDMAVETQRLLHTARQRIEDQRRNSVYASISDGEREPSEEEVCRVVREQAETLLTELLGQSV